MKAVEFVAIDLETTGKYPVGSEICEIAMIRFTSEGVLERFESLVRPKGPMTPESEAVHGLSLADLKSAPQIEELIPKFVDFVGTAPLLGHNLPFDLGFLSVDFDRYFSEAWWVEKFLSPNFCTSLISLQTNPKLRSHRLKDLAEFFEIQNAPNHRAMQDAQTCMEVFLKLTDSVGDLDGLVQVQQDALKFESFSIRNLTEQETKFKPMAEAVDANKTFQLMYSKGSKKNKWRPLEPKGLVLKTKDESFLVATDPGEVQTKRFLLNKVVDTKD